MNIDPNRTFDFDKQLGRRIVYIDLIAKVLNVPRGFVIGAVFQYQTRFDKKHRFDHVVLEDNLPAALDRTAFYSVFSILNRNKDFCTNAQIHFFHRTQEILSRELVATE